ncbi:sensor histidine kinase [Kribbella sp. NPDC023855]|uniref:sensor histidine kinase n=1 Tax=Kribbella sp. NPDC023855 TaxID=3154698 RepID=UPI0033F23B8D
MILLFPDGLLPGNGWRLGAVAVPGAALIVNVVISTLNTSSSPLSPAVGVVALALFAGVLVTVMASLVVRYRTGSERTRQQLRWLLWSALSVPILLVLSWFVVSAGVAPSFAYAGFLACMLVVVPAAIAVAIVRHDLLDVDRLLGGTVTWAITSLLSAGSFAGVVILVDSIVPEQRQAGVTGAAFVTALALLPLYHRLHRAVGRLIDRDHTVAVAQVRDFVGLVRDRQAPPEEVEEVLRSALRDPDLQLILRRPGQEEYVDVRGRPAVASSDQSIPLQTAGSTVALLVLGNVSARRVRLAGELAREARLPIEVSRLQLELREALAEVSASRARLMSAVAAERKRIERDLHDGTQQRLVAIGMRMRSLQQRLTRSASDRLMNRELDELVEHLEDTINELRRIAHGVRPSGLDDGLSVALRRLAGDSSVPVSLNVHDMDVAENVASVIYFTVGEALTNTMKHAHASQIEIEVLRRDGLVSVEIRDDGVGGAREGFGLTSLRDRIASVGGDFSVVSNHGSGTTLQAVIPCES